MMLPPEFVLGPFKVDRAGMLSPATHETFPRLAWRWRDRLWHARLSQVEGDDDETGRLALSSRIGRVPSSATSMLGQREGALALLHAIPPRLPPCWRLRLLADHVVQIEAGLSLRLPVSAVGLVSELSAFLLAASPFLDVLDEGGMDRGGCGAVRPWLAYPHLPVPEGERVGRTC